MNGISRETYEAMKEGDKLNVLFDYLKLSHECACKMETKLNALEVRLQRKKKVDSAISSVSGFVGGYVAMLTAWIFKN